MRGERAASMQRGFTLIEILVALLILSLLSIMAYRGLGAVLDTQSRVKEETEKWRRVARFFARFEHDVQLAAPRPVRNGYAIAPAWLGQTGAARSYLEFSRFPAAGAGTAGSRVSYALNARGEVEIGLWPGLDIAPDALPARYALLSGVTRFELRYLGRELSWADAWPSPGAHVAEALPRAVHVRLVFASGEELVRTFAVAPW
jgi:general secretion pathway protein J